MWIFVDLSRRFFFLIVFFGFLVLYGYHKVTQLYDIRAVRQCKSNPLSNETVDAQSYCEESLESPPKPKDVFIYIWNPNANLKGLKTGRDTFTELQCKYTNCFITFDESLKDLDDYNAIIFSPEFKLDGRARPEHKKEYKQKFIFASFEPESSVSMIDAEFDNYFNLTWTHRLDSDILWRHLIIHDRLGIEVGPQENMHWAMYYENTPDEMLEKLNKKHKAVAWITDCETDNNQDYIQHLNNSLQLFQISVDIFRKCDTNWNSSEQLEIIGRDYFFMLAMEKVSDKDYVNGDLLNAMQRLVVPIVRGGAEYSRFLPPLSYINTKDLTVKQLADKIYDLTTDMEEYQRYFQWRSHYTYKDGSSEICNLCKKLNEEKRNSPAHQQFRKWWYGGNKLNHRLVNIMDKFVLGLRN